MSEHGSIQVIVDKARLLGEFRRLVRLLDDYAEFLRGLPPESDWRQDAVRLLETHQAFLSRTRTSLRTAELATALLKRLLRRMETAEFTFSARQPAQHPSLDGSLAVPTAEELEQLVTLLNAAARTAPLEMQEKLRFALAGAGQLFTAVLEQNMPEVEQAITKVNLLTANRESRSLLREIAVITRDIYTTLHALSDGLPIDSLQESSGGLSEAVQKLTGVITRLEDAATECMDDLDVLNEKVPKDREALEAAGAALRRSQNALMAIKEREPAVAEAVAGIQDRLSDDVGASVMALSYETEQSTDQFISLMSNQGYHELAGQTLRRIIAFMEDLELQLLELLKTYQPVLELEPPRHAEEPREDVGMESTQDDVDRLLDQMGF